MGQRWVLTLLGLLLAAACLFPQQARRALIEHSFEQAFGRRPSNDELRYWMALPASDPRIQSPAALLVEQRHFLEQFPAERAAVVQRAFAAALHCQPSSQACEAWQAIIREHGTTYAELVRRLRHLGPAARAQCDR